MNVKTNSRIFLVLSFFGLLVLPFAAAATIGVSPAKLEFNLQKGESASQKVFLQNLETEVTKVSLTLNQAKFANQVTISPQELILPSQTIQEVNISIAAKKSFKTELEILSLAKTDAHLSVASGVKLPLEVKIEDSFAFWPLLPALILAVLTTAVIYFLPLLSRKGERG